MSDYIDEIAPFSLYDWKRLRSILLRNRIASLGLNPEPIEAAAQFQQSMGKLMEPISLPENRTEEEHLGLLNWLGMTTQQEVQQVATRVDENGVEHSAWQYTMTPNPFSALSDMISEPQPVSSGGALTLADIDRVLGIMKEQAEQKPVIPMMVVSPRMVRVMRHQYRLGELYRANPEPHRKLRKCHQRKRTQRLRAGREHIYRVELAERAREEAEMRRLSQEAANEQHL